MKNIFSLLLFAALLIFSSNGLAQTKPEVKKTYYESGKLESTAEYVNGVRNGWYKIFFENGEVGSQVKYINGKMEGKLKSYYPGGKIKNLIDFKNGVVNGDSKTYYKSGKLMSIQKYIKGKLVYEKGYTEDGKIKYEDKY